MARPSRTRSVSSRKARHQNPLSEDIVSTGPLREKSKKRKSKPDDEDGRYVDSKSSRKILKIGQDLVDEVNGETVVKVPNPAFAFESRFGDEIEPAEEGQKDVEEAWGDEDDDIVEEVVSFSDLWTVFIPSI